VAAGTLYLVATPIGNLEDITLRALRILRQVSLVACEDTRHTRKLLNHHSIRTVTVSFHRHNERKALPSLINTLHSGKAVALVTDGGTPSISDPGSRLAEAARREGIAVVPIPGPSALLAALVGSGFPTDHFAFLGFPPHRIGERRRFLAKLQERRETLVFFESPRRVAATLADMAEILGNRPAALCREMTKVHEEFRIGALADLAEGLRDGRLKGEVTLVVEGASAPGPQPASSEVLWADVGKEMSEGRTRQEALRAVARRRGLTRREVYRALLDHESRAAARDTDESE